MSTPRIDKTWDYLEKTERELHKHFEGIRKTLPAISRTPQPRSRKTGPLERRGKCYHGGLLNNLNTPSPKQKGFSTLFKPSFELVSFSPAREVVGKPRPLAYKIIDPHTKSGIMRKCRTPQRPLVSGFKSTRYLEPNSSRFVFDAPSDSSASRLEVVSGKVHTLLEPFPLRERRRAANYRSNYHFKNLSPVAFPKAFGPTGEAKQTRTLQKLEIALGEYEDEDKNEPFDPILLPKYS